MIRKQTITRKAAVGIISILAGGAVGTASAQNTGPYAAIGAAYATSNADSIERVAPASLHVQLRAGYGIHKFLAVEADTSFVLHKEDFDPTGVSAPEGRIFLSRSFAGYLVARYPVTRELTVFARGGYHRSRVKLQTEDIDDAASFDNAAFGGGASYHWGRQGVRADYTVLRTNLNANDLNHRVFGLSYVREF